jgi:pilus assembly protein CpaF
MSFEVILPFLRPIEHLLQAKGLTEIMVNPDNTVWVEEKGDVRLVPDLHFDQGALLTGLEVIANRFGKKLDQDSPILNVHLPDGSRLAAMIPPIVHPAPVMTIRKFTSRSFTLQNLIEQRMLTHPQAVLLADAVRVGHNILISGGTGTGKTTLLNVLAESIPTHERILTIEDTAELDIRKPHVVSAECQMDTHKNRITFDDLLKAVLRHRPDRIIVGEVRGPEARTLLDAMNTGHHGTLATIHASGPEQALRRLATLALRAGSGTAMSWFEQEIRSCVDFVVHVSRKDGHRSIESILRCHSVDPSFSVKLVQEGNFVPWVLTDGHQISLDFCPHGLPPGRGSEDR